MYRKGTVLVRKKVPVTLENVTRLRSEVCEMFTDIINDDFWKEHDHLLT